MASDPTDGDPDEIDLRDAKILVGSCDHNIADFNIQDNYVCDEKAGGITNFEATQYNRRWIMRSCGTGHYGQYVYLFEQDDGVDVEFTVCEVEVWGKISKY